MPRLSPINYKELTADKKTAKRLRKEGHSLRAIGEQVGKSRTWVSLVCSGKI